MTVADVTERQRFAVDLALDARLVEVAAQEAWVRVALHQLVDLRQTYVTRHMTRHTAGSAGTSRSSSADGSETNKRHTSHDTSHDTSADRSRDKECDKDISGSQQDMFGDESKNAQY